MRASDLTKARFIIILIWTINRFWGFNGCYTIKSLVYVTTTNFYLEYVGYMFRPVNRSSSGHQSNKSNVLLRYWDPIIDSYIQYKIWY